MSSSALQDDIIELQTRLQFQDDALQQLDTELLAQKNAIDLLLHRIHALEAQIEGLRDAQDLTAPKTVDEKPPHY